VTLSQIFRSEVLAVARDEHVIGCIGILTVATRGSAGPGEVQVKVRGGTEAFIAWSSEPLPKGTSVLVIESRGHRAVDVSTWDDPLVDFPELTDT
jgi:membrane protein implicated in regulation of membrane protease activity